MHFLVPTGIFHPESGGPATYLLHLLPELLARGHTLEVVTFGEGDTDSYPYPVTRIPRTGILSRNWAYYRAVQARLRTADRVFINSLGIPLPPIRQPKILKIVGDRAWERCINRGWLPPDTDIDHFQTAVYGPLVSAVRASRSREARRADRVIVPSQYLQRMVTGWGVPAERIHVIYNAYQAPPRPAPVTRAELGLPEGPLLLVAARLTAWKGVDAVLDALAALPDIHLLVAGSGEQLPALQAQAERLNLGRRVCFLGDVPRPRLADYYATADYTVLYSGYEGLSHVILESFSARTPVIASDKGGNPEIVTHNQNGLLVPYKDRAALRAAFEAAFKGDTPARLRAGVRPDSERFAWPRLVEQTLAILTGDWAG